MRCLLAVFASSIVALASSPALAACTATSPSTLQATFPGISLGASTVLAPALTDVAALSLAETNGRTAANDRGRRLDEMRQRVEQYDAQKQARRRPLNFHNGQSLLQSLVQPSQPDPPSIASARAELKAAAREQGNRSGAGDGGGAIGAADAGLAAAVDRLSRDTASGGSYRMLVDGDRLMRERIADCAAWRSSGGAGLPLSMAALDRYDQSSRATLNAAAAGVSPRLKAEIAAARDSATLQRLRRDYMPTPATGAAMEATGVAQALAAREATVQGGERALASAEQARRTDAASRAARAEAAAQARQDAADQALLTRQRAAQGTARAATATSSSAAGGEPTEAQMRAALQANAGRVAGRMGMGDWTKITYFEKVGCEKAQGRIGWQCDFLTRTDGNPMSGLMDVLAGPDMAMSGSARFVLRANGWDVFRDPAR